MSYTEDQMLLLSGIQHYMFCPRQWALISLEQQWAENRLTAEGRILHKNVDDPEYRQKNGLCITLRSVSIASQTLGLYGLTDAVELSPTDNTEDSIQQPGYPGYWKPMPIEYKHGHKKHDETDEVQLAAQVICLEEQYHIHIFRAALFYWETRTREYVNIDDNLRNLTHECAVNMHKIFEERKTPEPIHNKHCINCSMYDLCLPKLNKCGSASSYLENQLYEETP